ncbi:MAG: NAD(P)-dependent oxidoreductase [Clostridia bacterium]|nr:NAD(P)-dependent oxidoreductase [Clostridia bacterium]
MKILVIGGTGHVGAFLVPMLLEQGHEVYVGTRGTRAPHTGEDALKGAKFVICNGSDIESLKALRSYHFDAVVEFPGHIANVWEAFKDNVGHIVACGSLWMFGYPRVVPTPEQYQGECPFDGYAKRYAQMREMIAQSGMDKAVFTAIMPPNICGPGKIPLDCLGGRDIEQHKAHQAGKTVYLPDGPEVLLSPCDAEDIAALFALAINNRTAAAGQIFNVGPADSAVTSRELVRLFGEIYDTEIPVETVSWDTYRNEISPGVGWWWHFYAHMAPDISKARTLLGYEPQYTVKETLARAVDWMRDSGLL